MALTQVSVAKYGWNYRARTRILAIAIRCLRCTLGSGDGDDDPPTAERANGEGTMPVMLGQSKTFQLARMQLRRYAGCDVQVLIEGETGTGKELAAREIHYVSARRTSVRARELRRLARQPHRERTVRP